MKKIFIMLIFGSILISGICQATGFSGQFHGVGYGPYHYDTQHPGTPISRTQIKKDLTLIWRVGFRHVRTFTVADGMDQVPSVAQEIFPDLKIYLGVYENAGLSENG